MGEGADRDTVRGPSLTGRFAAAIALAIGFYLLAIVLGGGLLAVPVLMVASGHFNLWLGITCLVLGVSIFVAAFPRRQRFHAPGVRIDASGHPRLVALIEEEAAAMGEDPPDEVYATMEVTAAVTQVGRRRRVMIVGLPLLQLLSERGFRGVVAHELGHYAGGDTRLGPWIYRTRETIVRTVVALSADDGDESWSQRAVRQPFIWYGNAFLRITNAISRRQEFAADACAAQRAGRDAHVEALRRIHAFAPLFDHYWQEDVVPVLRGGRRPPLAGGFALVAAEERIADAAGNYLERELAEGKTDPYDSHPSLAERIAAVEHLPPGDPDDSPPAGGLLTDPATLERELAGFLFGSEAASELEPLGWDDVAAGVYVPMYERLVAEFPWIVEGEKFATLPDAVGRMGTLVGRAQQQDRELTVEEAPQLVQGVLGAGGVLGLRDAGWTVHALPGRPVECRRDDLVVVPHQLVAAAREDGFDLERFRAETAELGIADVALDTAVARAEGDREGAAATAGAPAVGSLG